MTKSFLVLSFFGILCCGFSLVAQDVETQVEAWLSQMTLEEKVGQMTQVDIDALAQEQDITKYALGSLLAGGNSEPKDISAHGWASVHDRYQSYALKTRLAIPLIFGIDAVHGNNNVQGAVIFPHHINMGATRNPALIQKVFEAIREEIHATGIAWTFAPCVAVARNERWGRTYESFGEDPALVSRMAEASIWGLQGKKLGADSILACAKHFLGDGGTENGIDQGNTVCDEQTLRKIHLAGYEAAIKADVGSIMVSYSSWNGNKMHGYKYLLTDLLKDELKFSGFVVSDWAAIDQLPGDYKGDVENSINAGLDMVMIPNGPGKDNNYVQFITYLLELVKEGKVSQARIDDAVRRILRIKVAMGLTKRPYSNPNLLGQLGSPEHRQMARECVRESLVLLKNEGNLLPLAKKAKKILVAGKSAHNIGNQCGGWTIAWQGQEGDVISGGTTILDGIRKAVSSETEVIYSKDGLSIEKAEVALAVVGETPYAEMMGDKENLTLDPADVQTIENLRKAQIPIVLVLVTGRPLVLDKVLSLCDAILVAWLPGTEGNGVSDVLFGDFSPTGKLPHSWPASMKQIPVNIGDSPYECLFPYGFSLTYPTGTN